MQFLFVRTYLMKTRMYEEIWTQCKKNRFSVKLTHIFMTVRDEMFNYLNIIFYHKNIQKSFSFKPVVWKGRKFVENGPV